MTSAAAVLRRTYELHGIGLEVCADEPAVIEAMELRLRDFGGGPQRNADMLRFEFHSDSGRPPDRPEGPSRPVYDTPHGSVYYHFEADALWGELGSVELRCEASRGVAIFRTASFAGRELYLATHPLATISLMELLERRRRFSLHAACLATEGRRGVLLAGPSGSGKSTLALALARAGMSFLSDDIVFLDHDGDSSAIRVLGFADAAGVSRHAASQFAEIRDLCGPPADGFPKPLRPIDDLFGRPALTSCTPSALVFPEVAPDHPSDIAALDPGEALLRLVPDVLVTEPAATQAHLRAIAALLESVRCYALRSGSDLERAVGLVRGLV
jgi:hypothetical protein